jgi:hypothetical protein
METLSPEEWERRQSDGWAENGDGAPATSEATPLDQLEVLGWKPVGLGALAREGVEAPVPTVFERVDGSALFYPGTVNGIHGPSGDGKSFAAACAILQVIQAGDTAAVIDFEDSPVSWTFRLLQLGALPEQLDRVQYWPAESTVPDELVPALASHRLVVIDSAGEGLGIDGHDSNIDLDVTKWFRRVPTAVAKLGPAVAVLDHTTKLNKDDLWPAGSGRKRAAISGAAYVTRVKTPLVKGNRDTGTPFKGRLTLVCAKDRHGTYQRGAAVADLVMGDTGRLTLYPNDDPGDAPDVTAAEWTQKALIVLAKDGPMSKKALKTAVREAGYKAGAEAVQGWLELAIARRWLTEEKKGRAHLISPGDKAIG